MAMRSRLQREPVFRGLESRRSYTDQRHVERMYGLSPEEYGAMVERRVAGADCRRDVELHVDHDHKTGKVRALLDAAATSPLVTSGHLGLAEAMAQYLGHTVDISFRDNRSARGGGTFCSRTIRPSFGRLRIGWLMATQLFFTSTVPDWSRGQGDADQQGTTQNWSQRSSSHDRGGARPSRRTRTSIAGPVTGLTAGTNLEWISDPLDADTTISGTVTFNLWGNQAANANNTGLGCIVQRLDSQGAIISTIVDNPEIGTELPNTTPAVRNETASPTSTNMLKGDRLRIRVYFNDAAGVTMGSGGALVFRYAGTTAAVNGDSYVTFTENFGFLTRVQ